MLQMPFFLLSFFLIAAGLQAQSSDLHPVHSGWEAFAQLSKGNQRFQDGKSQSFDNWSIRALSQKRKMPEPQALVLTCSDSRVNPDIIFDLDPGNLFLVRNAGMLLDSAGIASVELAISRFQIPLIVVLGSELCFDLNGLNELSIDNEALDLQRLQTTLQEYVLSSSLSSAALQMRLQQQVSQTLMRLIDASKYIQKQIARRKVLMAEARFDPSSGKVYFWKVGLPNIKNYSLAWDGLQKEQP